MQLDANSFPWISFLNVYLFFLIKSRPNLSYSFPASNEACYIELCLHHVADFYPVFHNVNSRRLKDIINIIALYYSTFWGWGELKDDN